MPEYIDRDATIHEMKMDIEPPFKVVMKMPAADVVPKSEADEIVRQWKEEANCWQNNYITELRANEQIRAEVSREIFEEIEELAKIYTFPVVKNGVVEIAKEPFWCIEPNDLAELKNKYTENEIWRKMKNERNISNRT